MNTQKIKVQGFVRLELRDVRGKYKGRKQLTPWIKNVVTTGGFEDYIVGTVGAIAGSKVIGFFQLSTQTTLPLSSQNAGFGEIEARATTTNSFIASGTLRAIGSWATNLATQSDIGCIGQYDVGSVGTNASLATFATSAKTTDQELRATYEWRFS